MSERATLEEVKEFANKVRAAGGGNPIDALMPAVPEDPSACLIARNLNFNCEVNCAHYGSQYEYPDDNEPDVGPTYPWVMVLDSEETRDKIAEALDLVRADYPRDGVAAVILPERIGQVAADFDTAGEEIGDLESDIETEEALAEEEQLTDQVRARILREALESRTTEERALIREMLPYIESSALEAYSLATAVNERGEILL